jgi:hypothetical protein
MSKNVGIAPSGSLVSLFVSAVRAVLQAIHFNYWCLVKLSVRATNGRPAGEHYDRDS